MSFYPKSFRMQDKAKQKQRLALERQRFSKSAQRIGSAQSQGQQKPPKTAENLSAPPKVLFQKKSTPIPVLPSLQQQFLRRPPIIHPFQIRQSHQNKPNSSQGIINQNPKESQESENDKANNFSIFEINPCFQNSFTKTKTNPVTNKQAIKQAKFKSHHGDLPAQVPLLQSHISLPVSILPINPIIQTRNEPKEQQGTKKENEDDQLHFKPRHKGFYTQKEQIKRIQDKPPIISQENILQNQLKFSPVVETKKEPVDKQKKIVNKEDDQLNFRPRHKGFFPRKGENIQKNQDKPRQTIISDKNETTIEKIQPQNKQPSISITSTTPNIPVFPVFPTFQILPSAPVTLINQNDQNVHNAQNVLNAQNVSIIPTTSNFPVVPVFPAQAPQQKQNITQVKGKIQTKQKVMPLISPSPIFNQIPPTSNAINAQNSKQQSQINANSIMSNYSFISQLINLATASRVSQHQEKLYQQPINRTVQIKKDQINLLYDRGILPSILPKKSAILPKQMLHKYPQFIQLTFSSFQLKCKMQNIKNNFDQLPKINNWHIFSNLKIKDLKQNHKHFSFLKQNLTLIQKRIIEIKQQQKSLTDKYIFLNEKGIKKALKLKRIFQFQLILKNILFANTKILNLINNQAKFFHPIIQAYFLKLPGTYSNPDQGVVLMSNFIQEKFNLLGITINVVYEQNFLKRDQEDTTELKQHSILASQLEMICLRAFELSQIQKKFKILRQILSNKEQRFSIILQQKIQKEINQQWQPLKMIQQCVHILQRNQRLRHQQ